MRKTFEQIDPSWEKDVHQDFIAIPVRQGEPISAQLSVRADWPSEPVAVWRMSPAGVEIINDTSHSVEIGQAVVVVIAIGTQRIVQPGMIVRIDADFTKGPLIGIFFDGNEGRDSHAKHLPVRKVTRWTCHPMFFPTGTMNNPSRFFDKAFIRVLNISRSGLMVATSLRNKFLLRGLELSGILSCPLSAPIPFRAKIISSQVKKVGTEVVNVLGLAFVQISETDTEALGLYIARFGSHGRHLPSPRRLKKEGYGDVDVSDAIEWDYVRTQDDYQKVLELRRISYRSVEGWPADADDHLISDPFDERARIVIGRFRDTIIATLRVCFHEKGDVFEEELYITFPADFPARNTLVEASRAAIHPEFRGTHVFMNMMRFTMLTALQAGRKWFVQSTYDYLSHIYMRLGFKKVGGPWMHPQLTGRAMQMFIGNVHSVLHARYGNPFQYQSLVPHIEAFLKSDSFDELTLFEKSKLKVWKISAPLFKGYTRLEAYRSKMNRNIKFSKRLKNGILGRKQSKS